jgi:RNA-directed DNA polymerase
MSKPESFTIIKNTEASSIADIRFVTMLVAKIASGLGLSTNYVALVARTSSYRYRTYQIPKKTVGFRTINHPARELKLIQRWLVKNVLAKLPVHRSATAYKKGANVYRNAAMHRMRNYLLKVDFKDFFPSIKGIDVALLLRANARLLHGFISGPADVEVVRQFVCRGGELTIGAPSSPLISNLVMFEFDGEWSKYCRGKDIVYSRYADDLFFSTNQPNVLQGVLDELRRNLRSRTSPALRINEDKTVFTSRKRRRLVTGLVLTSTGEVSLGRDRKRFIKSLVFRNTQQQLPPEELASLRGMLSYVKSVEPSFIETLRNKYGPEAIGEA